MFHGIIRKDDPLNKKPEYYYCTRHSADLDHTALHRCYRPRLRPPHITAQGPLLKHPQFWAWMKSISPYYNPTNGIQDLPITSLKTALLMDGPWENQAPELVSTGEASSYSLLITAALGGGYSAMTVRRIQNGPFADNNHEPIIDTKQYAIVEAVEMGPTEKTIGEAVISFNMDLEDKLRHRKLEKIEADQIPKVFGPLEYRCELSFFQAHPEIEEYEEELHGEDNLYAIWSGDYKGTGRKGVYVCLGEKQGKSRHKEVLGPWALLSFTMKEKERDVEVLIRDARHCNVCFCCLHGLL